MSGVLNVGGFVLVCLVVLFSVGRHCVEAADALDELVGVVEITAAERPSLLDIMKLLAHACTQIIVTHGSYLLYNFVTVTARLVTVDSAPPSAKDRMELPQPTLRTIKSSDRFADSAAAVVVAAAVAPITATPSF